VKRLVLATLALLVIGTCAAVRLSSAGATSTATRSVCHRTASKATPYVKLRVSVAQYKAHLRHAADIAPAPRGACPRTLLATTGGRAFGVTLVGETESPAGDPVATADATVRLRAGQGQVCYRVTASDLATAAVAMHIHKGAPGASGPVVIPLATPSAAGKAAGCAAASRTLVASILANPAGYYLNVHTSQFPNGAVRGQLSGTSAAAKGWVVAVDLKGTSEPNATGSAVVRLRQEASLVCYRLHAASVTLPTVAAHIHRGAANVNGPVVVPFTAPGADGNSSGCTNADPALIGEIAANPAGFYVNVHTKEHPAGAIRSQLG
jgi:hypothetical protein